ncbi:putative Co/Zn/Cd efflux system membrane fusion protein [Cupriavidus sp. U2]|nr:putative Co/Zn/Cd efflux system membrane fusion protein [Cupriavidus sp. U2]
MPGLAGKGGRRRGVPRWAWRTRSVTVTSRYNSATTDSAQMVAGAPAAALQLRFARFWRAAGSGRALSGGEQGAGAGLDRTVAPRRRARIPLYGRPVFCCAALSPLPECLERPAQPGLAGIARRDCHLSMLRQGSQQYCRSRADSVAARTKPPRSKSHP